MDQTQQEYPTARLVSFVEPTLADLIIEVARQNERSVSAELRRALRNQYLEGRKGARQ